MDLTGLQQYTRDYAYLVPLSENARRGLDDAAEQLADLEEEHHYEFFTRHFPGSEKKRKTTAVGRLALNLPPIDPDRGWTIGAGIESDFPVALSPDNLYNIATVHAILNLHPQTGLWTLKPVAGNTPVAVPYGDDWYELTEGDCHSFTYLDGVFRLGDEEDDLLFQVCYAVPEKDRADFFWQRHEYMQQHFPGPHFLPHQIPEDYPTETWTDPI